MIRRTLPVIFLFILLVVPLRTVRAQQATPTPLPPGAWSGEVTGKIVNRTEGAAVPPDAEVMLHAWDADQNERLMEHGQAGADGNFRFENITLDPGLNYSAMADYKGVGYYAEPAQVKDRSTPLEFEVPVYETTNDLSGASIAQMHALFYVEQGQFTITQVYVLSNSGTRTITGTVTLPRNRTATLKFRLPENAENVTFEGGSSERFVLLPDGFADTAPLIPGQGSNQAIVTYNLPYDGNLDYSLVAPVAVDQVTLLAPENSGLKLEGSSLTAAGTQQGSNGSSFAVYTAQGLKPDDALSIRISGKAQAAASAGNALVNPGKGLAVGVGVLGLVLLGVGVWWYRRPKQEGETEVDKLEDLLSQIADLDSEYQQGGISQEDYAQERAALLESARSVTKNL
ncbi:MAG TPA: hypothetical protein VF498_11110 [Anaerolineales bacterium]